MTTHRITLTTRDGQPLQFDCDEGEDVVSAAARATIILPAICKNGSCGSCRATHVSGPHHHGDCSPEALPREARARGEILLCRTQADGDLQLRAPFDHAHVSFQPVPERQARISQLEEIGGHTVRLVLTLEEDEQYGTSAEFEPGQYVELTTPDGGVTRAYSVANTANWEGRLEFLIHLQPQGRFSTYLAEQAAIGDLLKVRGPQGGFVLQDNGTRPRCFVAGGTGLAPMLSMLRRMAEFGEANACTLLFGVTRPSDLFGLDDIRQAQDALPGLRAEVCVWQADAAWKGRCGTPVDALAALLAGGCQPDIYLCGPPAMIDAAEKAALAAGIPPEQIFSERFLPT